MLNLKDKALHDYFDTDLGTDAITFKGHRIGLHLVLDAYLAGKTMREMQDEFATLTPEELSAAIAFYWLNREELDRWLVAVHAQMAQYMAELDERSDPVAERLHALYEQQRGAQQEE
ncbi:MAG TPA: DUF433 domain-containing protein [Ktedonobacterales bacterium]|nr:DUF433 domain-containing protein [Ktedonobacterales bacterium]